MEAAAHGHSTLGIPKKVGEEFVGDAAKKTLYVYRPLINTRELMAWAIMAGFDDLLAADDLHVTIAYSKTALDWAAFKPRETNTMVAGGFRFVEALGPEGAAVCLIFQSDEFAERHRTFDDGGASWDWPQYRSHITITYKGGVIDLAQVIPYAGPLEFGPEVFEEVNEGWADKLKGALDAMALDKNSVRSIDKDGHLRVERTPISKAVVNPYVGNEIPNWESLGLDPERIYQLYRDPEELKKGASTFAGKPIMIKHQPISADDHPHELVAGAIGDDVEFADPYLMAPLTIWDQDAIDLIESGEQRELSCGYRYVPQMIAGKTDDGEPYDGRMTKIEANHLALVSAGRAGPDVIVGDSALPKPTPETEPEIPTMAKTASNLSRKAAIAHGALLIALAPKLAKDAKVDLSLALDGVTSKNFAAKIPTILEGVKKATVGKLAKDAKLDDLALALDAVKDVKAEDDMPKNGMDEEGEKKGKLKEFLKGKLSEDDMKACDEMMDDDQEAMDEEEEEDKSKGKDKKAKDAKGAEDEEEDEPKKKGAEDEEDDEKVDKKAMDSAIRAAVRDTEKRTIDRLNAIQKAKDEIAPYVGKLAIACDSATEVYKAALDAMKVDVADVHPSAYSAILKAQRKPGEKQEQREKDNVVAMDSASVKSFGDMFPKALPARRV